MQKTGSTNSRLSFSVLTGLDRSGTCFEQVLTSREDIAKSFKDRTEAGSVIFTDGVACCQGGTGSAVRE